MREFSCNRVYQIDDLRKQKLNNEIKSLSWSKENYVV